MTDNQHHMDLDSTSGDNTTNDSPQNSLNISGISNESSNDFEISENIKDGTIRRQSIRIGELETELFTVQSASELRIKTLENHIVALKIRLDIYKTSSADKELCASLNVESVEKKRKMEQEQNQMQRNEQQNEIDQLSQQLTEAKADIKALRSLFQLISTSTSPSKSGAPSSSHLLSTSSPLTSLPRPPLKQRSSQTSTRPQYQSFSSSSSLSSASYTSFSSTHSSSLHLSDMYPPPSLYIPQPPPPPGLPPNTTLPYAPLLTSKQSPLSPPLPPSPTGTAYDSSPSLSPISAP